MSSRLRRKPFWVLIALLVVLAVLSPTTGAAHSSQSHTVGGAGLGSGVTPFSFYVKAASDQGYAVGMYGTKPIAFKITCAHIIYSSGYHFLWARGTSPVGGTRYIYTDRWPSESSDIDSFHVSSTPGPSPCGGAFGSNVPGDHRYDGVVRWKPS